MDDKKVFFVSVGGVSIIICVGKGSEIIFKAQQCFNDISVTVYNYPGSISAQLMVVNSGVRLKKRTVKRQVSDAVFRINSQRRSQYGKY